MKRGINNMSFTIRDVCVTIIVLGIVVIFYKILDKHIFPWIANKCTKEIEKNPKWIMPELKNKYYGFHDLDIILVNSPLGMIPRFKLEKKTNRLQLLIPEDTTTRDLEEIAHLALMGKLKIKYNAWYPDKPTQWLSILNYLLDGGDIRIEAVKWEELQKDE